MMWNWQQPDWPDFSWNPLRLAKAEQHFLRDSGVLTGAVKHLGSEDREELTVEGGLSAGNYMSITGASPATATRDLADMVEKGALVRYGERRHARYNAGIPVRVVTPVEIDE